MPNFTPEQAETITDLVKETQKASFEEIGKELATKQEIFEVKNVLKQKITEETHPLKTDVVLLKRMTAFILAGIASLLIKIFLA